MLTVKSGLDPHMIIELEDDLKSWTMFMVIIMLLLYLFFSFNVGWYILVP
jgi:hypothetical protein